MIAKTATQRVQDLIARRKADGLKELRGLWAHPDDHQSIREHAEKLARKRLKAAPRNA